MKVIAPGADTSIDRMAASSLVVDFFRTLRPEGDVVPVVLKRLRHTALAAALLSTAAFSSAAAEGTQPGGSLRLATAAALQGVVGDRSGLTFDLDTIDAASKAHMALLDRASQGRSGASLAWSSGSDRTSGRTVLASISRIAPGKSFDDGKDRTGAECAALISAASFDSRAPHPMVSATLIFCRSAGGTWELVDAGANLVTLQELHKKLDAALARPGISPAKAEATMPVAANLSL